MSNSVRRYLVCCAVVLLSLSSASGAENDWAEGAQANADGATRDYYNRAGMLAWDHFMGDWRDAKNIAQGDDPYATASVVDDDQGKFVEWDATGLVRDWVDEKHQNQGFFEHAMVRRGYSKRPVLLGQSRGGLMMLAWAMRRPESVGAFAGIYPVCNLESWPLQRSLASTLKDYGMDEAALRAKIKTYNPIDNLAGLAAAGVPLFFIHGDSDPLHGRPQLQHE